MKHVRVSLRDLFWLLLVAGVFFASWAERMQSHARLQRQLNKQVRFNEELKDEVAIAKADLASSERTRQIATQWAHVLYRDMSDHFSFPTDEEAIRFANQYMAKTYSHGLPTLEANPE